MFSCKKGAVFYWRGKRFPVFFVQKAYYNDEMMEKWKKAMQILLFFCKIGCFTFGGGWSIVAQMQQEFVEKRHWINEEELLDFTSVARSLPGIMIANTSLIFGYHMAGIPGALAAVVGITIPSVVIIALVTLVYDAFRSNPYVLRALTGVRAAVIPIILSAALRLRKGALKDWIGYVLAALAAGLSILGVNNFIIILLGVAAGLLIGEAKERMRKKEGDEK